MAHQNVRRRHSCRMEQRMQLPSQRCRCTGLVAEVAPSEASAVVAAYPRKLCDSRLHSAPVERGGRNSRFENDGRRSSTQLVEMNLMSADVNQPSRGREAQCICSLCQRLVSNPQCNQECEKSSGDGQREHGVELVGYGEFAGKNRTRARQMTSYRQSTHEREHTCKTAQAENVKLSAARQPPPQQTQNGLRNQTRPYCSVEVTAFAPFSGG